MASKKRVGDVGEHWVLYRLVREGFTAVLAPRNAEAVDILATDDKGRAFSVQVKAKTASSKGWRLTKQAEHLTDERLFYCLVDLGQDPPEVYVVPATVVARHVSIAHADWLKGRKANGEPRKDSAIRELRDTHSRTAGEAVRAKYPPGWLNPYKEAWGVLTENSYRRLKHD